MTLFRLFINLLFISHSFLSITSSVLHNTVSFNNAGMSVSPFGILTNTSPLGLPFYKMSQNDDMWETTAMKNALLEANGAIDSKSIANTTPSTEDKAVAAAKARDHGWVEPEAYNYSAYNANPEDLMEAPIIDDKPEPHWYSQGAVYEWDDEYGEVGPENPELEKGLFFSELRNKKGDKLQVYEAIKIFMEAEEGGGGRVSPVTRVSPTLCTTSTWSVKLTPF